MIKHVALLALFVLNLVVTTGCGRGLSLPSGMVAPRGSSVMAQARFAGKPRKLGFDLTRAQVQRRTARPRQLPPVQGVMPSVVDLRPQCSPVYDQEDLGSCTAFAVGKGAREILQRTRKEPITELSALYLYYETRKLRNAVQLDSGATITDAMTAIRKMGIASDAAWPYQVEFFTQPPPEQAYRAADEWKLTTGLQLVGLEDVKKALLRRQPVVFGMRLYNTFQDIGPDGVLPLPQAGDVLVGGHAVTAVGYDNRRQVLIVRNSFGDAWGDQGYFYMPYAYVTRENVMDIWTAS
jgi:C1A family cysteine protease